MLFIVVIARAFISFLKAMLCDKDTKGTLTSTPSFAKIWFMVVMVRLVCNLSALNEWWWLLVASILSYILFGAKFIPAFFTSKSQSSNSNDNGEA